jgi:dethiobiotin synthetase
MRILVIGTDVGVGKSWVARSLAQALEKSGKRVVEIKPLEILRLADPWAPILSGDRADEIDFDALVLKIERLADQAECAIIEGAGGLLTPVTWEWNMADVARALGAAALVVGADRLGTINQTLLTLSALELAGIPCAGVVLTNPESTSRSSRANGPAITRLSGLERVLTLPVTDEKAAAESMLDVVSWLSRVAAPT